MKYYACAVFFHFNINDAFRFFQKEPNPKVILTASIIVFWSRKFRLFRKHCPAHEAESRTGEAIRFKRSLLNSYENKCIVK
jgi:hypothetical protein